jgi:hypothetical protein
MTASPVSSSPTTAWRDSTADPVARLDALIAEMSLTEKVAQLGSLWLGFDEVTGEVAPMQNVFSRKLAWPAAAADGLGHFTRIFGTRPSDAAAGSAALAAPAAGARRVHPTADSRNRARGMFDRVHHVSCDRLSHGACLGRHVRPGAGEGDGFRHRS